MDSNCTSYGEKEILADALEAEKSTTNIYNTFANECVHPEVRDVLINLLNEEHDIQFDVFNTMHERGFYPTPPAEEQKIKQTKAMHAAQAKC